MSFGNIIREISGEMYYSRNKVLENTAHVLSDLNLKNIHIYFYIYCYLLWNGYFSETKNYEYNDIGIDTEIDLMMDDRYTMFTGKGVCRHNSLLLSDLSKKLDIDSKDLSIRVNSHDIKNIMGLTRYIGEHLDHESMDSGGENHAVNLAKTKSGIYILDSTILCEHEVIGDAKLVSFSGPYNIDEKIFHDNVKRILKDYPIPDTNTIKREELISWYKEAKKICEENIDLFDKLYKDNLDSYKSISKLIKYFRE